MRELIKATLKTGSATLVSLAFGVITNKILAWFLGPSGLGLFSLIRQTEQTAHMLASFNGGTAIVQGIAARKAAEDTRGFLITVLYLFLLGSLMVGLILILAAPQIAFLLFGSQGATLAPLVRWLAIPVFMNVGLTFVGSVLNGYRAIGYLAVIQMVNSGVTALLAYPAAILAGSGNYSAFIGLLVFSSGFSLVVGLYSIQGYESITGLFRHLGVGIQRLVAARFFSMSLTILVSGLLGMGALLALKAFISVALGLDRVGIFEVAWTLSLRYIMLLLASFGSYYLPALSREAELSGRRQLMHNLLHLSTIIMVPMLIIVVVLKPLIVELFYSPQFLEANRILRWMLIADYLKITSWVFGMPMLAFPDMKTFFWSELIFNLWLVGISAFAIFQYHWIEGIGVVFLLLQIGHISFTYLYTRIKFKIATTTSLVAQWTIGLSLIVATSLNTWNDLAVQWSSALFWLAASVAFSVAILTRKEKDELQKVLSRKTQILFRR